MLEKIRLTVINNLLKFHPVSTERLVTTHPLELVLSVNPPPIPFLGIQCSACYGGGFWSHASAGEGLSLSLSIYLYIRIHIYIYIDLLLLLLLLPLPLPSQL